MKSVNEKQKNIYSKANQTNKNQEPKQSKKPNIYRNLPKGQTCDKFYRDRQLNFSTSNIGKRYLQNESKTLIL